jgi:hypothetical protein
LSLPPLKGGGHTYVALALLVFSAMVAVQLLSQHFVSFLHNLMASTLSITRASSN